MLYLSMRKSLFLIILSMVLLAACGGGRGYDALMHEADSLLTAGEVTSAYTLLAEADSQKTAWSRRQQMAYELLKAQAQNQAYVDFQTDSVMREVARYYDRHGTHNERLKAHYLLGCTYRDLHEAPLALLSWEDAIASADTTAADCDYATLFRVYGQMAGIYFRQYLPEKQLEADNSFCKYALLAGDTLNYIRGLLLCNTVYYDMGDSAAVFQNIKKVRTLYLERGLSQEAARVYPIAIAIALDNKQYQRAYLMMQTFENQSSMFDENGNIWPTHEKYYYEKGRYYIGTHQPDSAKEFFYRLLGFNKLTVDAYRGLLAVYKEKKEADSIFKYNQLYEDALVRYLNNTKTEAVTQAISMYDYSTQQRIAQEQQKKAHKRGYALITTITTGCIIIFVTLVYFHRKKMIQEKSFRQATCKYLTTKEELEKAQKEVLFLRANLPQQEETQKLLNEKATRIQDLEHLVKNYQERLGHPIPPKDEELLMNSSIVLLMKQICRIHSKKSGSIVEIQQPRACSNKEWQELLICLQQHHYSFFHLITVEKNLPKLQYKVCVLSRLHFEVGEMAVLLDTSMSNISNARKRAAQRLFDSSEASLLDTSLPKL